MLRNMAFSTGMIALIPTISAASPVQENPEEKIKPPPMKLSELPIYEAPHAEYGEYVQSKANENKKSYLRSVILPPVRAVRETAEIGIAHTESVLHTVQDNYHEFRDRTDWMVKYLREEENKEIRYGAVAMGGLTGFIFGLRGGIIRVLPYLQFLPPNASRKLYFGPVLASDISRVMRQGVKSQGDEHNIVSSYHLNRNYINIGKHITYHQRVLYAGLGTTAMGAICFPEETKELAKSNGVLAKQYINIAYNFLYGVKPGDPQLEVKFPEFSLPKNFSEFVDLTVSFAVSAKQAIMPPPTKDEKDKPSDSKE